MGKITIKGEIIEFREEELRVDELQFWPENPRVYSVLRKTCTEPTQKAIEDVMTSLDNVKQLRNSIKVHGGLTHPIFVRNKVVIEGNSRLAAYRILCRTNPMEWGKIRCNILPDDLDDELVFSFVGSIHIHGVTEWTPFEQAGYLVRHQQRSKKPIEAIAKDCGLTAKEAKLYVKVYETMLGNDDTDQSKWSYYFEMLKNKHIMEKSAKFPSLNLIDKLCDGIKDGSITGATDLRKVGKIASVNSEDANNALQAYLQKEETLDSAVAQVSEEDKKKQTYDVVHRFKSILKDKDYIQQRINDDEDFKFELLRILSRLKNIIE